MKLLLAACLVLAAACDSGDALPADVSELRVFAPLHVGGASVAYLTLQNHRDEPLGITSIRSPQFAEIAVHRSTVDEGIARMSPVDHVEVPPNGSLSFTEGGLHIMLMDPPRPLAPGDTVTLVLGTSTGSDIVLRAGLRARGPAPNAELQ